MNKGLLDFVSTPEGQGLLSAAFGGLAGARRGQPINSLGRAGLAGLAGYSGAQDREMQLAENAKQNQVRDMQIKAYEQTMSAAQRKALEEERVRGIIASQFAPVTGANANAASGVTGPRPEAAAAIGQMPARPNYQALIAQGVPVETAKALAEAENFGRAKVARTVKGMGPDGREFEYQVDDYGQRIGEGLAQYRAPIQADTGGAVQFLDPYTQKPVSSLTKSMSPEGADASKRGWATVGQGAERLRMDRANAGANGYTFNADLGGYIPKAPGGQFVPLSGIPASAKGGTSTEGERKAGTLLARLEGSLGQLEAVTSKNPGAASPNVLAEAARSLPFVGGSTPANALMSGDRQRVEAAQLDILDAALTLGTGAAYTKEQLEGYRRSFFPQLADSEATIKDKQARLENVLEAARIAAGRSAPLVPKRTPQAKSEPQGEFRIISVEGGS